jgi:electron transfer flavoprotein beta subunit
MNILVLLKHVPDLVEELEVDPGGCELDRSWVRYIPSEQDEHAIEQAILLKEAHGGTVTIAAMEIGEIEDALFTAAAKGADTLIRIPGDFAHGVCSQRAAEIYAQLIREGDYDLILTGVQAIDDLDGPVGSRLAALLQYAYAGVIRGIEVDVETRVARLKKEFPGGLLAVLRAQLPLVVGIQSSELPPRYVPIARIRQASKTTPITNHTRAIDALHDRSLTVSRMYKPVRTGGAKILEGSSEEIADQLIALFREQGILR